ncbi:MAG TPA: DUF2232 domain-containing protein [Coriobacteriia bacterium]|nr:DUF2232 domain-containing protein [Coriobacteriia bacterium]
MPEASDTPFVRTRDAVLLVSATVFGGLVVPLLPLAGLPLAAAGIAGLVYRERVVAAALASGAAVGLGTLLVPIDGVLLVPVFAALLLVVGGMRRRSALTSAALLTAAVGVGLLVRTALLAQVRGMTIPELMRSGIESAVESLTVAGQADGGQGAIFGVDAATLGDTLVRLWPFDLFASSLFAAVVAVAAAGWAAGRSGAEVRRLPRLDALDLSPHVLWPFIGAVALLAVGRGMSESMATTAGLNVLLGVRLLLLAQGLGVVSALYRRVGIGGFMRVAGYVLLVVADMILPVVSVVGLIDFWANFRKLPRDDNRPAEEPEDRTGEA